MKYAQRNISVTTLLALASLSAMASSSELSGSKLTAQSFHRELAEHRELEEDFNLGELAGNLWDSVSDSFGFGDGNGDGDGGEIDLDLCTFVEAAIGMTEQFGVSANCTCKGDWTSGLSVGCNFDECAPNESDVCGKVDLQFTFGGIDGPVDMTACADFAEDQYQKTCFAYSMEIGDGGIDQSCTATYGGQPCECSIENNICLNADCSAFVPGASINTCQYMSMVDEGDVQNFFPDFEIFQPDFQLQAENVPWQRLDFENLDFNNFDVGTVQWGENLNLDETWVGLIGDNPTFTNAEGLSSGVCKMMYQAANLSDDLGMESSCSCGYDEDKAALKLSCDFEETCAGEDDFLCGSVSMNLTYASLTEIYADVCITYLQFPETCYSYGVPFIEEVATPGQDLTSPFIRDCAARYGNGDNSCKCTIDENWCLTVDCSDFEPLAVTDECQIINLEGAAEDPSAVVLNFRTPGENDVVSDGAGGEFVALKSSIGSGATMNSAASFAMATALVVALVGQIW